MKAVSKKLFPIVLFLFALFSVRAGVAQQTQASLTGSVLDPQGASIPNADVTVTNTDTSIARTVKSNGDGLYTVTNLNPGPYTVTVKAAGFTPKKMTGIVLAVGQQASLNVPLALGSDNTVVEVNASADVTDTVSSAQGGVIDNKQVVGLPLNQRTFYGLALLEPAAYMPGQNSTLGFRGGFNVAGNNETANTFTVNGIDDNDQNVMAPSFRPSVEAIQEFRLLTGVYPAEYGRTSGGQVVVITKTGTNAFHGDVFEFIRNSQFDAKNAFTLPGQPTTLRRNQFGGTLGGPIIKDKAFFFLSYEGMRLAQPVAQNTFVPNPAFLNGDFSAFLKQATPVQLKDPNGNNYVNNQIPASQWSKLGRLLLQQYPAPNQAYNPSTATAPGYTFNEERIENLDEGSARVDYKVSDKDSLLFQYNYFNDPSFEPNNSLCGSGVLPGFGCTTNQISTLAGINWTRILNANWLNEFRVGFDRLEQPRTGQDAGDNFPAVPGAFNDPSIPAAINGGVPNTQVSGYATLHPYTNLPQHRWDNHYNIVDNVTWTHGQHNFKFGVNLLNARYKDLYVAYNTGQFTFTGTTSNGAYSSGSTAADVLLGYASTSQRSPTAPDFQVYYYSLGGYFQDDWKVTPNLTINLGLRYEYFSPTADAHNILSNYVLPDAANPAGSLIVEGQNGVGRKLYNDDLNNFGPRVGLAWQPYGTDKTVVHASYGLFYNAPAIGNGMNLSMGINPPFRLAQQFTSTVKTVNGQVQNAQVQIDSAPFPSTGNTPNGSQSLPYQNVSPTGADPNFRTLYMDEFGADVQQQLTPTMALTIGYIGNEGARIPRLTLPNQGINAVPTYAAGSTIASGVTSTKPITGTAGPVLPNFQNPGVPLYYQWGNISYYRSIGHSSFNAMTVKLQKNYANGFSATFSYTWGKSMDNAPGYASSSQASSGTPQNTYNLAAERGLSDFNVAHRIVFSPVYELPFGKNKTFITHGIAGYLAGGWQLSGIYSYDTGRPFTIGMSTNRSGSVYGSDRPNLVGDPNASVDPVTGQRTHTRAEWFNTHAFAANNYAQFGNAGRNIVIGPRYLDLDAAIQRAFILTERYSLQFRAEAFNVTNTVSYLNPLGTGTGNFQPASSTSLAYNPTSSFGQLQGANDPRSMQFSLKFLF